MTTFADQSLTGRRADQPPVALYFDAAGPVQVDDDTPFAWRAGARYQSGAVLRFGALFIPSAPVRAAAFAIGFGPFEGRLLYDSGAWMVVSPDAEGDVVPVAESRLLAGVEYAVSIAVDIGTGLYRDVIVEGRRITPQVVDVIEGPEKAEEVYTVDVLTGGQTPRDMPEWAKEAVRSYDAEQLLEIARQRGGRFDVSRIPPRDVESVPRPAPLAAVDGDPVFTFTVEADGPVTIQRAWAVEA